MVRKSDVSCQSWAGESDPETLLRELRVAAGHKRREIFVAHRNPVLERTRKRHTSPEIPEESGNRACTILIEQPANGLCRRSVRSFGVSPREKSETAVQP